MKVRLEFNVDNEQFCNRDGKTEQLLDGAIWVFNQTEWTLETDGLPNVGEPRRVMDFNGNTIGKLEVLP